jgi:iron complex outermembrane receptor protein
MSVKRLSVQVVQEREQVRIVVVGKDELPKTAVRLRAGEKFYGLNEAGKEAELEIVVTTEALEGYRVPNASTATRTDTPLRDIPQSIQVVPQQVIRDRNAQNVFEAVETVSGVLDGSRNFGAPGGAFIIQELRSW